jgi:hypothetical protein
MKFKKRVALILVSALLLMGLLTGCGLFGAGPRDGKGPRQNGSGFGPCSWFSCVDESSTASPMRSS